MYAQCPECLAIYKLGATPIAAARGRVRCGSCAAEFDAMATLIDELPSEQIEELPRNAPGAPPLLTVPAMRPHSAQQRELFVSFDPDAPKPIARSESNTLRATRERDQPPRFARQRHARPMPASPGWWLGCTLLALVLGSQFAWLYREPLLANKPIFDLADSVCLRLGCRLPTVADRTQIGLVARDVRPHPTVKDALVISATLANRAPFGQPFPMVEITLADPNDLRIAMRRFRPEEYVSDGATLRQGLQPGASTQLTFEVVDPGKNAVAFEFKFL